MVEDSRELSPRPPKTNGRDRSPAEIRQDIQRTRADIDQTLAELGHEMQPSRVFWRARQQIEPEVRAAAQRVRGGVEKQVRANPKPLLAGAASVLGLFALRVLAKRRKNKKRAFPPEQKGF